MARRLVVVGHIDSGHSTLEETIDTSPSEEVAAAGLPEWHDLPDPRYVSEASETEPDDIDRSGYLE